jgi:hypothetical protein
MFNQGWKNQLGCTRLRTRGKNPRISGAKKEGTFAGAGRKTIKR